jgi:hypothetical protein
MYMPTFDKLTDAERAELAELEAAADAAVDAAVTALREQRDAYNELLDFARRIGATNADAAADAAELESEVEYRLEAVEDHLHNHLY